MRKSLLIAALTLVGALMLSAPTAQAQSSRTINGIIVDSSTGEGLVGATVMVKNANQGVTSGKNGEYERPRRSGR